MNRFGLARWIGDINAKLARNHSPSAGSTPALQLKSRQVLYLSAFEPVKKQKNGIYLTVTTQYVILSEAAQSAAKSKNPFSYRCFR